MARLRLLVCLLPLIAGAPARAETAPAQDLPRQFERDRNLRIPGLPQLPLPPGARPFGPQGPNVGVDDSDDDDERPRFDRRGAPPRAAPPAADRPERPKSAEKPRPPPVDVPPLRAQRARVLDALFERLAKAEDDDAVAVANAIERVWARSGSETADLLMSRAGATLARHDISGAERLLDVVAELAPGWAHVFVQRGALRAARENLSGALADYRKAVEIEPRHFGAQTALGMLYGKQGDKANALAALRKALELYPAQPALARRIEQLRIEVEGRDI